MQTVIIIRSLSLDTPPSFSAIFSKGDNCHDFLFAYLEDEVFLKMGSTLKGTNLHKANSFLHEMTPPYKEATMKNDRIAFPESYLFTLIKPHLLKNIKKVVYFHEMFEHFCFCFLKRFSFCFLFFLNLDLCKLLKRT